MKTGVTRLFMLSVRFPGNSRLLVVRFWGSQKLYTAVHLHRGPHFQSRVVPGSTIQIQDELDKDNNPILGFGQILNNSPKQVLQSFTSPNPGPPQARGWPKSPRTWGDHVQATPHLCSPCRFPLLPSYLVAPTPRTLLLPGSPAGHLVWPPDFAWSPTSICHLRHA